MQPPQQLLYQMQTARFAVANATPSGLGAAIPSDSYSGSRSKDDYKAKRMREKT